MDLRDAADRIGVLHLLRVVREGQTAPVQKPQQILCRAHLPLLAAQRVHLGIKGTQDAQLCLARHGGGDIRRFCQLHGVVYHAAGDGGHDLRAVDERKALLGRKLNGRKPGQLHCPFSGHDRVLIFRFALAQHDQHDMRQRRKIAARAERALLRDHRMHAAVQHGKQRFERRQADAGIAACKRVAPQQHRPAHDLARQRRAHAAGMADDQIALKRSCLLLGDKRVGKFAEAGRQTVDHGLLRKLFVHVGPCPVDFFLRRFGNSHLLVVSGHRDDLLDRQLHAVEFNHVLSAFHSICRTAAALLSYKLNSLLSIHRFQNIYSAQKRRFSSLRPNLFLFLIIPAKPCIVYMILYKIRRTVP